VAGLTRKSSRADAIIFGLGVEVCSGQNRKALDPEQSFRSARILLKN
jgi:hypothetical protein